MPNVREVLNDRFVVFSGIGLQQAAQGTAIPNADLDVRDKCTISREFLVERRTYRNCRDENIIGSKIVSRLTRWTFDYPEITPQMIARWTAYKLGGSTAATGTPANEVQTLARTGTVSGGTFTIALTMEGRTVTTKPIAYDASTAAIQAALTAARMLFIQPGDVTVGGTWGGGITLTFPNTGRLGRANIPAVTINAGGLTGSTPGISVTESTPGAQNFHAFGISTSRVLPFFSFALGWDTDADRVEKYIDAVVESLTPNISLDGNVTFQATVLTPWEEDSIETTFDIPECVNIDALQAQDCRVTIDSVWQTTDINSLSWTIGNAIPTDRLSAFPFDGIDIQNFQRGRQPVYGPMTASIFGSEQDSLWTLAKSERTADPVDVKVHFGFPGNRCSWLAPEAMVMFQTSPQGEAGEARYSTIQIEAQPEEHAPSPIFDAEAYLDQTEQFLDTP